MPMNSSDIFHRITQMLSQLTQIQQDLIALKDEFIELEMSPSEDNYPVENLKF